MGEVQPTVLPDEWSVDFKLLQNPVVKLSSDFELQGTQRMGNVLETVDDTVSEVISRVDTPFVPNVGMGNISDPVCNGVSHTRVHVTHVNL